TTGKPAKTQIPATEMTSAETEQSENSESLVQQNASLASQSVEKLDTALKEGRQAMTTLISGVAQALQGTQAGLATLKRVESVGRRIEKIVESIALVAVQSSMLAVSGAVEAARAGEAGRGFAVVSNAISGLAR